MRGMREEGEGKRGREGGRSEGGEHLKGGGWKGLILQEGERRGTWQSRGISWGGGKRTVDASL